MSGRDARRARREKMLNQSWPASSPFAVLSAFARDVMDMANARYDEAVITGTVDLTLKTPAEIEQKIQRYCNGGV